MSYGVDCTINAKNFIEMEPRDIILEAEIIENEKLIVDAKSLAVRENKKIKWNSILAIIHIPC
jgi:hypothetical protein